MRRVVAVVLLLGLAVCALAALGLSGCAQQVPPAQSAPQAEGTLRTKAQCAEAGKKARQEWVTQYNQETFSDDPEYGHSTALNTCLYADEYFDVSPGERTPLLHDIKSRRDRFVLDVFSGQVLVEYTEHDGASITTESDPVMCRTEQEFEARKAKLFGAPPR